MPQINALPPQNSPDGDDIFPSDDTSDGNTTKKLSLTKLKEWLETVSDWVSNDMLKTGVGEPGGPWDSYTPSLTNINVGSGSVVGKYKRVGNTVHVSVRIVLGAGGSVSGSIGVSIPVGTIGTPQTDSFFPLGVCAMVDEGSNVYPGFVMRSTTTSVTPVATNSASTYLTWATTTSTVPFTWSTANADKLNLHFSYEVVD